MADRNGRTDTRIFASLAEALAAGALDGTDPGVQKLVEREREQKEQEESSQETPEGEELYKVLFIGDKKLAHDLSEGNERLSAATIFDPNEHSLDDVCKHIADVVNTAKQYDAIVFCDTDMSYLRRFCQDKELGMSKGYGIVIVYAGPVDLNEATQTVKDVMFGFNPDQAGEMPFLMQNMLIDRIEEGKEYLRKFKPAVILVANSDNASNYSWLEERGYPICSYPPTKDGCKTAWSLLRSSTSHIGALIVDRVDGPQEILLRDTLGDHKPTKRVIVGNFSPSDLHDFNPFYPYEDHKSAARGLPRVLEGYNPEDKADAATQTVVHDNGVVKEYGPGGRITKLRMRFEDPKEKGNRPTL